jgi:8-oxo-dGTP pyrophosphatase MutT (NUDIX family)
MALADWTLIDKTLALQTRIFKVLLARYRMPRTGQESTFSVVDSPDWVNVVALDKQENLILIRQFRVGMAAFTIEVPGGMVDPGEQPRDTAARELYEESGYRAERIIDLGFVEPNPAIFNNRAHMFLAEGCEHAGAQVLDEGEDIEVVPTPVVEVLRMLHSGQITHALVHVALSRYELYAAGQLALDPTLFSSRADPRASTR